MGWLRRVRSGCTVSGLDVGRARPEGVDVERMSSTHHGPVWPTGVLALAELEHSHKFAAGLLEADPDGSADATRLAVDAYATAVVASGAFDRASELLTAAVGVPMYVSWSDNQDGATFGAVAAYDDDGLRYAWGDVCNTEWYGWLLEQLTEDAERVAYAVAALQDTGGY